MLFIGEGGEYGDLNLTGLCPALRQGDVALRIRAPKDDVVKFGHVTIKKCGMPLRHESGWVEFDTLKCSEFTADLWNSIGYLKINTLIVEFNGDDFIYSDQLHVDALGQFFNHLTKIVEHVDIKNITAVITGAKVQGMALTEPHLYRCFNIGYGVVNISIEYRYAFFANTLSQSTIDFGANGIKILARKKSRYGSIATTIVQHGMDQDIVLDDNSLVEIEMSNIEYQSEQMVIRDDHVFVKNYLNLSKEDLQYWHTRWANFPPHELSSRDFSIVMYCPSLDAIQRVRTYLGYALHVTSASRTPAHNKAVGGVADSDHTVVKGRAINGSALDVAVASAMNGRDLEAVARANGFNVVGRYRKQLFAHLAIRPDRGRIYQWGYW